jgi:hypothetical protein
MVQAIMEGRKTMTRRVVKPQPHKNWTKSYEIRQRTGRQFDFEFIAGSVLHLPEYHCPYGGVGDVLWVRETWAPLFVEHGATAYKASVLNLNGINIKEHIVEGRWRPSIHMPKSRARIWLQITSIKVERLQDISEDDAIAEGIDGAEDRMGYKDYLDQNSATFHPKLSFESLWESINGAESWDSNPWVWVIEFKQIKK